MPTRSPPPAWPAGPASRRAPRRWPRRSTGRGPEPLSEPVRSAPSRRNGCDELVHLPLVEHRAAVLHDQDGHAPPSVCVVTRIQPPSRCGRSRCRCTFSTMRRQQRLAARYPGAAGPLASCTVRFLAPMAAAWSARARADYVVERQHGLAGQAAGAGRGPAPGTPRAAASIRSSSARSRAASATVCGGHGLGLGQRDVERGPHRGQRGAQLVRGVGDEPALRGERVLQPLEQPVDGVAEFLELVSRAGARPAARPGCPRRSAGRPRSSGGPGAAPGRRPASRAPTDTTVMIASAISDEMSRTCAQLVWTGLAGSLRLQLATGTAAGDLGLAVAGRWPARVGPRAGWPPRLSEQPTATPLAMASSRRAGEHEQDPVQGGQPDPHACGPGAAAHRHGAHPRLPRPSPAP